MAGRIDARMAELGVRLPEAAAPAGNYVPYVVSGSLVFISGQISIQGDTRIVGTVGGDLTLEDGQRAARLCATNLLVQLKRACDGDLDRVARCVRLGGFVRSTPEFTDQPKVVNGASDLIASVFGDAGKHARAAVSVPALPFGVAVEVDGIFEIRR